ncbi:CCHC-type domain-containing protein [Trichonephila clavipes]|nr:CCHC-type domain-containing protein [Trichonephila clavipes]
MRSSSLEELSTLVIHPTTYNISWELHETKGDQKTLVGPKSLGKKNNVIICFHCGRLCRVSRYCRDRRRDLSAARQRQLDQYECWDSDYVSDYGRDPESNYHHYKSNSPYPRRNPQNS